MKKISLLITVYGVALFATKRLLLFPFLGNTKLELGVTLFSFFTTIPLIYSIALLAKKVDISVHKQYLLVFFANIGTFLLYVGYLIAYSLNHAAYGQEVLNYLGIFFFTSGTIWYIFLQWSDKKMYLKHVDTICKQIKQTWKVEHPRGYLLWNNLYTIEELRDEMEKGTDFGKKFYDSFHKGEFHGNITSSYFAADS